MISIIILYDCVETVTTSTIIYHFSVLRIQRKKDMQKLF